MSYSLIEPLENNREKIMTYKLNSILEYAENLSQEEMNRIKDYVDNQVSLKMKNYKMISIDNKIVGCLLLEKQDDGILIDEIYLEENYRNRGIGTDILKNILLSNNVVYLWVYKLNTKAFSLYKKLNFKVIEETETRYYMKYSKQ